MSGGVDKHKDKTKEGTGHQGDPGDAGDEGNNCATGNRGQKGSGPDSGEAFEEHLLAKMLDVDDLLQLERAAGKEDSPGRANS